MLIFSSSSSFVLYWDYRLTRLTIDISEEKMVVVLTVVSSLRKDRPIPSLIVTKSQVVDRSSPCEMFGLVVLVNMQMNGYIQRGRLTSTITLTSLAI